MVADVFFKCRGGVEADAPVGGTGDQGKKGKQEKKGSG